MAIQSRRQQPGSFPYLKGKPVFLTASPCRSGPIGVIGTAPAGASIPTMYVGDTGGNMDNARYHRDPGLFAGTSSRSPPFPRRCPRDDGDGELNGTALEMPAEVRIQVGLIRVNGYLCPI